MRLRMPSPSLVISIIALVMATTGTAVAAVNFARNAGAVDRKSAVSATATLSRAAGKLVATSPGGTDRGKIPAKFLAGVVRGGSQKFGRLIEVVDNANGAPQAVAGLPGLGTLTVACNDQNPRPGVEDPLTVVSFANGSGGTLNVARRGATGDASVLLLQPGAVDSFNVGANSMFDLHVERNLQNLRVEGVIRQDGRNTAAAACLAYGYGLGV